LRHIPAVKKRTLPY